MLLKKFIQFLGANLLIVGQELASVGVDEADAPVVIPRALLSSSEQLLLVAEGLVASDLATRVRAFHKKFGHPVNQKPHVPEEAQVRFRLALIAEEFAELVGAALTLSPEDRSFLDAIRTEVVGASRVRVDLPEFVDALADLEYVIEGTRAVFGVDGAPIMTEVHRANMDKDAVFVEAADSAKRGERIKPVKPLGWRPPAIREALLEQGWVEGVSLPMPKDLS